MSFNFMQDTGEKQEGLENTELLIENGHGL